VIKAIPVHYGWIILAAGAFGSFMTLPGQTAGVSVFFDPITADLGISRISASIAYAAGTLAGILPAPIIGRWIDRRGPASQRRSLLALSAWPAPTWLSSSLA
jgi:MFS family permease